MSDDVLITPASRKIEFFDNGGNIDGKIELDGSGNLNITSAGSIAIGDITQDIHIGDGTQAVDLVFDFTSSLYPVAGQDLTIGKSSLGNNDIIVDSPNWSVTQSGVLDVANLKIATAQGSDGQVLTSTGSGVGWEDAAGGAVSAVANGSNNRIATFSSADALNGEANLVFDGTSLGVGTTSPDNSIHVKGSGLQYLKLESTDNNAGVQIMSDSLDSWLIYSPDGTPDLRFFTDTGYSVSQDAADLVEVMTLDGTNHRVGIGTTSPGHTVHVLSEATQIIAEDGSSGIKTGIKSGDAAGNVGTFTDSDFNILTNDSTRMRITSAGDVGIGTTSPGHLLEVAGGGANGEIVTNRTSGAEIKLQAQASTAVIGASSNHTLALMTNGSQRLKINNVGGIEAVSNANGWNLWHKVTFGKLDYGTAAGQGAGLNMLTFDDNEAGLAHYPLPRDITIHAIEIRTNGVVLSGTTSQVVRIFANGNATTGTLTDISYNASQFTRHNSENSAATAHSLVITGVNGSYNAGDTLSVRRNSGTVDMGDYIVDVWFSIDNA